MTVVRRPHVSPFVSLQPHASVRTARATHDISAHTQHTIMQSLRLHAARSRSLRGSSSCSSSSSSAGVRCHHRPCAAAAACLHQSSSSSSSSSSSTSRASTSTSTSHLAAPPLQQWRSSRQRRHTRCHAQLQSESQHGQEMCLVMPAATAAELEADSQWIASLITAWLDDEWVPLDVHAQLGRAAGAAYVKRRQAGDDDMSSLVLGLADELLACDYREAFVGAFEIANKTVEMLMMRGGREVCCSSEEDLARVQRSTADS